MRNTKINIFKLEYEDSFRKKLHEGLDVILNEGFLSNHSYVEKFEEKFSQYNNSKYSCAVTNGTSALEVALRAINVKGKYVIVQSNTFIATAVAIRNAGAVPLIVDISSDEFTVSLNEIKKKVDRFGVSFIGAVMVVHIGGHVSKRTLDIVEYCKSQNIDVIEDCAQSIGAQLEDIKVGNFGRFGCFSFFTTKNMTTGEGGMVTCHNEDDISLIKSIRQFGVSSQDKNMHIREGANFKMTEFQALVGGLELERIDSRITKRRHINSLYKQKLDPDKYEVYCDGENEKGSYYKQIVILKKNNRLNITKKLEQRDIALTGGVYFIPLHRQVVLREFSEEEFPNSDNFSDNHICPPCYPELTDEEINYICKSMNELNDEK